MATANQLIPGYKYEVTDGLYTGEIVTILDNTIVTKEQDPLNQRKILVRMDNGHNEYMLPRTFDKDPQAVGVDLDLLPLDLIREAILKEGGVAATPAPVPVAAAVEAPVQPTYSIAKRAASEPITDPMDPRLDSFRPTSPKAKLRKYIKREMKNGMTDVEYLLTFTSPEYRSDNDGRPANVALSGETQSGKTLLIEILAIVWAEKMGFPKPMPIFTLSGSSGVTDFDLFGQTTSYKDDEVGSDYLVWLKGIVELACQVGGILYLDEVNAMAERVTSSLFSILDHRHQFTNRNKAVLKGGEYLPEVTTASLDTWVLASYNPGYRGMSDMNEAVINRFRHLVWDYDEKVERELVKSSAVRLLGEKLRLARKASKLRTPVGTSALEKMERDFHTFGPEMACDIMTGLFKVQERPVVEEIIQSGSIIDLLAQEQAQALLDAADASGADLFGPDPFNRP